MSNAATHALCPRCTTYEPVVWTPVTINEVHADGRIGIFKGMEMKCRACDFEITKVGSVSQSSWAGAA